MTELLVSIGVMVIISGIVIARYSSFNSAVLLKSQAYEIALAVRQAQLFAVAAQGQGDTQFRDRYGIQFDTSTPHEYHLFRDRNQNGRYDGGNETIEIPGVLDDRFQIRGFVDADDGGTSVLTSGSEFSITFLRPNFDAQFSDENGPLSINSVFLEVAITGETGDDNDVLRTVEVTSAGQITVQ